MAQPLWEKVWQFFKKLNIYLPHDPAIPLLRIYPREMKVYAHNKSYRKIFTIALTGLLSG